MKNIVKPLAAIMMLSGISAGVMAEPKQAASAASAKPAASQAAASGESAAKSPAASADAEQSASAADPANPDDTAPAVTSDENQIDTSKDPSEHFNRAMFTFNEKVDQYFMKPVATFYNAIVPKPLNMGIHNAYNNIGEFPTIANDLLQLNIYQMTNDLWRLGVNSTVGIGGLFDVATRIQLPYYQNDFGLTMAAYGYDDSSYLVLPFFGPSTWRDGISIPVDYFAFSIYPYIYPESTRYQLYALGVLDRRAQLLKYQDVLEEAAIDKYVFMRDAYLQRRASQIRENQHLGYDQREDSRLDDGSSDTTSEAT